MSEENFLPWKYWLLRFGLALSLAILLAVVLKLNFIEGSYYTKVARSNTILESMIPAARADIVDRHGRVVAESIYPYFKL